MATFYLLPPRECLEHATAEFIARILPGVASPSATLERILDVVGALQSRPSELFFIHREDLPGSGDTGHDLIDGFGAEPGDLVVEVGMASGHAPPKVKRWAIASGVSEESAIG
ncbi:hypothetical protein [Fimbriiglobus ruber]|uniref:Uncharacterized protein n=1 Tax=Fimbriiglobus ruber TaxID=1908690 RepID=A0A225E0F5_9BACT|nr:hypothetical protein [Fimbriiglobus ruber]OWK47052.1 hypothetical protein FRUB_00751 [Fimbriiglobus ruber]